MKASAVNLKKQAPTKDRSELPNKLRELVGKTRYEAPKVVSFPLNQAKGQVSIPQITMMGNM